MRVWKILVVSAIPALAIAPAKADGVNGANNEACQDLGSMTPQPDIVTTTEVPVLDTSGFPVIDPVTGKPVTTTVTTTTPQPPLPTVGSGAQLACHKQLVNRESLIHLNHHIQDNVVARLLSGGAPEPAGLALDEGTARKRLEGSGSIDIIPTADIDAAPAPARKWNAWIDGKFTWIEADEALGDTEGGLFNGLAGIDYKITDRFIVGLLGSFESSDLETDLAPVQTTKTEGYGGGAYMGLTVTDNIVLSATATGTFIDTDVAFNGVTADIESERLQLSGGATGYYYFGQTRFTPLVNVAYSKEWQDDFVDSGGAAAADQTFESSVLSAGAQLGHTFSGGNGMSIEPWLGAQLDWTFLDKSKIDGAAALEADDTVDIRVQGGFNVSFAENVQLSVMGDISGLLLDDTDTYAVDAVLAVQF
jgi:Autotransporter beta-domain